MWARQQKVQHFCVCQSGFRAMHFGAGGSFCLRGDGIDQQGQEGRQAVLERLEPLHEFIWHVKREFGHGRAFFIYRCRVGGVAIRRVA